MFRTKNFIFVPILVSLLISCGTTTIIKEVQVTQSPTTEVQATQAPSSSDSGSGSIMTTSEGIEWVKENVPLFAASSDSDIYSTMSSACEMIDSWAPDYDGWLEVFLEAVEKKTTEEGRNMMAVVAAATRTICTTHLDEVKDALARA
jgi:hypothetical protein